MKKENTCIDFSLTPKQAFRRGFIKGLSAPLMLFAPKEYPPLPKIDYKSTLKFRYKEPFMDDFRKIGLDFYTVIERHGKTTKKITVNQE